MRFSRTMVLAVAGAALLMALLAMSMSVAGDGVEQFEDWNVDFDTDLIGTTKYVSGSVFINSFAKLTIQDATLIVNHTLQVNSFATLLVKNGTIVFNSSLDFPTGFDVADSATVTIIDKDNDPSTLHDRSLITSSTDVNYNITLFQNASFTMRDTVVSHCGRYRDDDFLTEGIHVMADNTIFENVEVTDGYFGIVLERVTNVALHNVTIKNCVSGLRLTGTFDVDITNCTVYDNQNFGIEVRSWNRDMKLNDCTIYGSGLVDLYMRYTTGNTNILVGNTIGPTDAIGIWVEEMNGYSFTSTTVRGCSVGFILDASITDVIDLNMTDCTEGLKMARGGNVRLENLKLNRTTITIAPSVYTNVTTSGTITWRDVTGDLGCRLVVMQRATMVLDDVDIGFRTRRGRLVGIDTEQRSNLNITNSNLSSPVSGEWFCHLVDGATLMIENTTMSHLGSQGEPPSNRGLFLDCDGTITNLTILDSFVGVVTGMTTVRVTDLTIMDCQTGLFIDGDLGRRGLEVNGLTLEGCDVVARVVNSGMLTINDGSMELLAEGFNISSNSAVNVRDSKVGDPGSGYYTASLEGTSTLDFVNSSTSMEFHFGGGDNSVNILWYLNLTLQFLSDRSPLSDALVTVSELSGAPVIRDEPTGPDGIIELLELRESSLNPETIMWTPHTVTVRRGDLEDYFTITMDRSKDHLFLLDNYPPVITLTSPASGTVFNVSTVTVTGTAKDYLVTDHEGLESLSFRVDNGSWQPIDLPEVTQWTFDVILEDGSHVIEVEVVDKIGNRNHTSLFLEVDTTAPILSLVSPIGDLVTTDPLLTIVGRSEPGASVTINGVAITLSPTGDFNHTLDLLSGTNTITFIATDDLGNSRTLTILAVLDNTPPPVTFDHKGKWETNTSSFVISGQKEVNATIYVDGDHPEFFSSSTFSVTVELEEGLNSIFVFSEDSVGNNWNQTLVILLDTTPPTLTVRGLPEFTSSALLNLEGNVDDEGASVTVNGQPITLVATAFAHQVTLVEGTNTFALLATDALGNSGAPVVVSIVLDTQAPSVSILTNSFVKTVKSNHSLEGSTEPGLTVVVTVVYGPYTKTYDAVAGDDGSFTFDIILPQLGNHTITVRVRDEAGNRETRVLHFLRVHPDDVRPDDDGKDGQWLEDNWSYLVLGVSIVASLLVLFIATRPRKRRGPSQPSRVPIDDEEPAGEDGEWDEADEEDEEWDEAEAEGSQEEADEDWEEEEEGSLPKD